MNISRADIAWLYPEWGLGDLWCLTFVRDVDEIEALRRMGASEESIEPLTYEQLIDGGLFPDTVLAGRLGDWTALIEVYGWHATEIDTLRALSSGTESVSVLRHDYASDDFAYAVDGELITCFDPGIPAWRSGSDPDRLVNVMRDAGFDPDYTPGDSHDGATGRRPNVASALLLVARLTGVMLTEEILNGPWLGGSVA
ncbi:DUF6461 domain-containing protein [Microbispora bryophytorum]|uniref:DUF6461 domain-containing protein n=1 Tax=Microbispora bryophytorum TaxID=1460882 RepID=UPI0033EA6DF9